MRSPKSSRRLTLLKHVPTSVFKHLALLHRDPDLAIWGVLVEGIDIVEQQFWSSNQVNGHSVILSHKPCSRALSEGRAA